MWAQKEVAKKFFNELLTNLHSNFRASCRAATTSSGWGNFSFRGGPFFIPVHSWVSSVMRKNKEPYVGILTRTKCVMCDLKKYKDLFQNSLIRHFNSENTDLPFMKPNYYSFLCYSPFSPSTRVISKLFLRGFSGLRTTVSPGWAARRADFTSPALRPYTRQLLL